MFSNSQDNFENNELHGSVGWENCPMILQNTLKNCSN